MRGHLPVSPSFVRLLGAQASIDGEAPLDDPSFTRRACAAWAQRERRSARDGLLPVASSIYPDVADADPERVPFFDNLRPYMVAHDTTCQRLDWLLPTGMK